MTVRMVPRPVGDGWRMVPSVYQGGARSFWHRRTPDALEWVAYDRAIRGWMRTIEPFAGNAEITREPYRS